MTKITILERIRDNLTKEKQYIIQEFQDLEDAGCGFILEKIKKDQILNEIGRVVNYINSELEELEETHKELEVENN